jgi:hypothetical protein
LYAFILRDISFLATMLILNGENGRLEDSALAEGLAVAESHVGDFRCPHIVDVDKQSCELTDAARTSPVHAAMS